VVAAHRLRAWLEQERNYFLISAIERIKVQQISGSRKLQLSPFVFLSEQITLAERKGEIKH
jgi:hypothetical protein